VTSIRSLLERTTRSWILRRHLPEEFGRAPIHVSPSAGLGYLFRSLRAVDPLLLSLANEFVKPGAVVWDVGANVGLFAFAAANRAGAGGLIVSMEPDAWLVQLLRRSSAAQPSSSAPVKIVPAAVASELGLRTFCLANRSRCANHLAGYGTSQAGGQREEQVVVTVPLDWLLSYYPPPSVLKIDVEGAELEVLHGAARLFQTVRPIVVCEVGSGTRAEVTAFLRSHDYQLYDAQTAGEKRSPVPLATWNTLAIPAQLQSKSPLSP